MTIPPDTLAAADAIRQKLNDQVNAVISNGTLSQEARKAALARAYLKASADMAALQQKSTGDVGTQIRALTAKVWGLDDVVGSSGVDRAAASVSYRDAQDRAAALDEPQDALDLLARAEATGDELLARAIAARADSLGLFGGAAWGEVLEQYFSRRPEKVSAFEELRRLANPPMNAQSLFAFVLNTPSDLAGMHEFQMRALADDPRYARA